MIGIAAEVLAAVGRNAVYAAVLYAGVWLLLRLAAALRRWTDREVPPAVELLLWSAVAVRLVLPPGLAAPWSLRSLVASARSLVGASGGAAAELPFDLSSLLGTAGTADGAGLAGASAGAVLAPPWTLALAGLWALGVVVCLVHFGHARRRVRRRLATGRRLGRPAGPDAPRERHLVESLERWRRLLGVRRSVTVVIGSAGGADGSPCTFGVLRPVIWLPEHLAGLEVPGRDDGDERGSLAEAALAHELVHVRGLDDLWLRLLAIVRALFFFHPVAWWVSARIADARERAVDDAVLRRAVVSPRTYGRALLSAVAGTDPGDPSIRTTHSVDESLFPAFGSPKRSTPMRIQRIVRRHADPASRKPRRAMTLAAVAPIAVIALVVLAALPMAAASPGQPGPIGPGDHGHDYGQTAQAAHASHLAHAGWASPVHHARVTSPFGERHDPFRSGDVSKHHDGVDLGAAPGTPVLAPADGVVTVATEHYRPSPDWGTVIVVDHGGGLQTRYAHLGSLAVTEGQKVTRGDTLGTVGATGRVTGPHLHFEVLRDGDPVDPATLVADLSD